MSQFLSKFSQEDSEIIDKGHELLVELTDTLIFTLRQKFLWRDLSDILQEMIDATKDHFQKEEEIMERATYPDFKDHKAQHDTVLGELSRILAMLQAGEEQVTQPLLACLQDRLMTHLAEEDSKYSKHVADIRE